MRLQELRETNKKTQLEVANALNIHPVTYNNYEKQKANPNIDTLTKIADYYNVTIDYLVGRDFANDVGYLSEDQRYLLEEFKKLNPINQMKILAEIKGMLLVQD